MGYPKVFAIDGTVASGKSSVGRALAVLLGYRFVDTGLFYRALAFCAIQKKIESTDQLALIEMARITKFSLSPDGEKIFLGNDDISAELRSPQVEKIVSAIAKIPGVRQELLAVQRAIANQGNVVMVGRDIGSKIVPDAAKIFLTATIEERVRRRFVELKARGFSVTEEMVKKDVVARDKQDVEREEDPLIVADGAIVISATNMTISEVTELIIEKFSN
ncbi:MAG: (d)CMP kinase [SAR202 cluster bacterium]|nr:(d)CMP kinase [SAR202 cluster bacterium]|tara:strand:- start:3644 stop:4300 length:657 start_codon:yes stop_codon:yes gene_type:complete